MLTKFKAPELMKLVPDSIKLNYRTQEFALYCLEKINVFYKLRYGALDWKKEVRELVSVDRFSLIILDTARHDFFKEVYEDYLSGELFKAVTPASATVGTIKLTFPDYYDLTYYSGIPVINSKVPFREHTYLRYNPWEHFKVIKNVWDSKWENVEGISTVPPWGVHDYVVEDLTQEDVPRKIIHLCTPHGGWIGETKLSTVNENGKHITHSVKHGEISGATVRQAYEDYLKLGLEYVRSLIKHLDGEVVVTADHGELLGERNLYGKHPLYCMSPKLRLVPWLVIR